MESTKKISLSSFDTGNSTLHGFMTPEVPVNVVEDRVSMSTFIISHVKTIREAEVEELGSSEYQSRKKTRHEQQDYTTPLWMRRKKHLHCDLRLSSYGRRRRNYLLTNGMLKEAIATYCCNNACL